MSDNSIFRPFPSAPRRVEDTATTAFATTPSRLTKPPRRNPLHLDSQQPSSPQQNKSFSSLYTPRRNPNYINTIDSTLHKHSYTAPRPFRPIHTDNNVNTPPKTSVKRHPISTYPDPIYTPVSKEDNDRWLTSLGIDLSLLDKLHQLKLDDENSYENQQNINCTQSGSYITQKRLVYDDEEDDEDIDAVYAQIEDTTEYDRPTPLAQRGDVMIARSKRPSVRVAVRELDSLLQTNSKQEVDTKGEQAERGTEVFLTPLRATRRQKSMLGAEHVVTPVRRSLRLGNYKQEQSVPMNDIQERNKLLQTVDYAYTPNKNIQ